MVLGILVGRYPDQVADRVDPVNIVTGGNEAIDHGSRPIPGQVGHGDNLTVQYDHRLPSTVGLRAIRRLTSSTVPGTESPTRDRDPDDIAEPLLALGDDEEAGKDVLHDALSAEAQRHPCDGGGGGVGVGVGVGATGRPGGLRNTQAHWMITAAVTQ
jgi:hypothetical protein